MTKVRSFFNSVIDKVQLRFSRTFPPFLTKLTKSVQRVSFTAALVSYDTNPFSMWFSKIKKSTYWSAFQSYSLCISLLTKKYEIKYPSLVVAKIVCYDFNSKKFGEINEVKSDAIEVGRRIKENKNEFRLQHVAIWRNN